MAAELEPNGSWPDPVPGPLGTPPSSTAWATNFDLVQGYALQLPGHVICEMLGVPLDRYEQFCRWTDMFLTTSTATEQARYEGYTEFMAYAAELVAQHRSEPGADLIDLLIQARDEDDRLSEGELVNTVFSLITVIPSGSLSAGTVVMPNLNAANHDPRAFPEPGRFDIHCFTDHPPHPHVAFGYGPHRCLAASLARVELTEAIRALVTQRPALRLAASAESVTWTDGLVYRPVAMHVTSEG